MFLPYSLTHSLTRSLVPIALDLDGLCRGKTPQLLPVLRRIHRGKLALSFVLKIIEILVSFTYPVIVGRMIDFVEDDDAPTYEGMDGHCFSIDESPYVMMDD